MATDDSIFFAQHDLLAFGIAMKPKYQTPPHIELIADRLERLKARKIRRLVINMPPRHGKSHLISEIFPGWYLGHNPTHEVMFASYSQEVASGFGRKVRNMMSEPLYEKIFPNSIVSTDSSAANRMNLAAGGAYYAVGAGGPLAGRGANLMIIDDIHKNRQEADSEVIRERIMNWWRGDAYTRLMPDGVIVLVQTRWREDDHAGQVLAANEGEWEVLSLPAINEDGEALWPERYPVPVLQAIRKEIGLRDFESLYQQRPTAAEGNIIKRSWIMDHVYDKQPDDPDQVIITADLSYKEGTETDFTSIQAWSRKGANCYMIDHIHARMGFPDQVKAIRTMSQRHSKAWAKYIEAHANGQAVIDTLKEDIMGIIPVKPQTSKEARLAAVSPMFEAGNVHLPNPKLFPWAERAIHEIISFPAAAHDDIVDAAVYALSQFSSVHNSLRKITALAKK